MAMSMRVGIVPCRFGNRYLEEISGQEAEAKRKVAAAMKTVAARLGNKASTCRNYCVHPCVIDSYLQDSLPRWGS
jgi:DNA topoisomerase IB